MKLKCINNKGIPDGEVLTEGKIYEGESSKYALNHYIVENDNGHKLGYLNSRFEEVAEEKDLKAELKAAKELVACLEAQIQEKVDANKPKVGQRYKHVEGCTYMVAEVNKKFILVCIESDCGWVGMTYTEKHYNDIKDVFGGCDKLFKFLK
jgi:hypothetical protein